MIYLNKYNMILNNCHETLSISNVNVEMKSFLQKKL